MKAQKTLLSAVSSYMSDETLEGHLKALGLSRNELEQIKAERASLRENRVTRNIKYINLSRREAI